MPFDFELLKTYFAVMLGGAFGTALRYGLSNWFATHYGETFPVGTIVAGKSGWGVSCNRNCHKSLR